MTKGLVAAGSVEELRATGRRVVQVGRTPVLVLWHDGAFHALDNRCPHMGFPLHRGDVHDGILACHWHHARFDVTCGATLDPWADDVAAWRVVVDDGQVFVDPERPPVDARAHGLQRLRRGMEDDIPLVMSKAVVELAEAGVAAAEPILTSALHGATQRADGWQPGLSILSATANVLGSLDPLDGQRALAHAVGRIAGDTSAQPPRRPLPRLVGTGRSAAGLRDWFRETVEVRDADAAERVLRTLVEEHGPRAALDAVFAACTDHRYLETGHALDYATKCAELVDHLGDAATDDAAALLLTSLVPQIVQGTRHEETSAWRRPVDVARLVEDAWTDVGTEPFAGAPTDDVAPLTDEAAFADGLLEDDAPAIAQELVRRLGEGAAPVALADAVVSAATLRVLRFGPANETPDWDTVHHTLTYANAVAEGMRRTPSRELFRGVLDGAMSVYLDRFLNVPPAPLPRSPRDSAQAASPESLLPQLLQAYDRRGSIDEAPALAWQFLETGGNPRRLLAALGHAVLREDAGFHEFQQIDIAWRRTTRRGAGESSRLALTAAARWIASQFPTRRAREQTFQIARRLHRGEPLAGESA